MSLIINKITSASTEISYNYLDSNNLFGYDVTANYTVDIADVVFNNGNGILLYSIDALNEAYARKNIVARIGTDEFINGKIQSLSFNENSFVGSTQAKISIIESRRLDSYSNNEFTKNIASPQWIESFQETFNFSRSDDSYSFSRNVSIKYKQDAGQQFLNNAKFFLTNFYFKSRPAYGFNIDGISENAKYDRGLKTNITENIDLINLSISFSENFQSSQVTSNSPYSKKVNLSTTIDEQGFKNLDISAEIKALVEPIENNVLLYTSQIIDEYINLYKNLYGNPISIEKGINKDGGVVSLKISFTNNPSKNKKDFVFYTVGKNKAGAYEEYQLNINYSSDGKDFEQRFTNVKSLYSSTQSSYQTKISSLFSSIGTIYEKTRSTSFVKHEGKISENLTYSNDPAYNTTNGILKYKQTSSRTERADLIQKVIDLQDLNEKIIYDGKKGVGNGGITTVVIPQKSKGLFYGVDYLDSNVPIISGYVTSYEMIIDSANGTTTRVINYITDS